LAFPSVYEGFGFPPLEAMACGTPVVSSNAASMPEICGDAALLIPPTDVAQWAGALKRALTDRVLRADLAARGPARAARFNWQSAAQQTRQVYQAVLAG
jgi:glycosyltransferase involved in cell wall biosynthesis